MTPDDYCADKAAPPGSALHYALRTLPLARRRAATAVYAFAAEIRAVPVQAHDPDVARSQLAWWRDELRRAFAGAPQHPVAQALRPALSDFPLPEQSFQQILDGAELDLAPQRMRDGNALHLYLHHAYGLPAQLAARIYGYRDRQTLESAAESGTALGLGRVTAGLGAGLRGGRSYLPRDALARHGTSEEELRQGAPAAVPLIREQVARARALMDAAQDRLPPVDRRAQRAALALMAMERALLDEIDRDPLQVLRGRVALTPVRKLWIAWKTTTLAR